MARGPLFVARQTYRRRRLIDASRLVPVLVALLFLLPILATGSGAITTLRGGVYVFLVWLGLIGVTTALSRRLVEGDEAAGDGEAG